MKKITTATKAGAGLMNGESPKTTLTFDDAIAIANGCFDYGGGYATHETRAIFHHGIQTVLNALRAAKASGLTDMQSKSLHAMGSNAVVMDGRLGS